MCYAKHNLLSFHNVKPHKNRDKKWGSWWFPNRKARRSFSARMMLRSIQIVGVYASRIILLEKFKNSAKYNVFYVATL